MKNVLSLLAFAAMLFCLWVYSLYTIIRTEAGYVILAKSAGVTVKKTLLDEVIIVGPVQAKECDDGEGCAIFSQREYLQSVAPLAGAAMACRGRSSL